MDRRRTVAARAAGVALAAVLSGGGATPDVARASGLEIVTTSPAPSVTDGKQYAAWIGDDGRLRVRDSLTRRTRSTAVLCPPGPLLRYTRISAGLGLAVVQCGSDSSNGRHLLVTLRSRAVRQLQLPAGATVDTVGRYWIRTFVDARMTYVNRASRKVRTVTQTLEPGASRFPVLDVDSRTLRPITLTSRVSRLLFSGALDGGSGSNGRLIRDPQHARPVDLGRRCSSGCTYPFGRVGRLVYTQGVNESVVFLQRGKPARTWTLDLPFLEREVDPNVYAQLTDRELVVATPRQEGTYDIRIAAI